MWYLWLIIAGLFFVGEIFTHGFLIFWFGIASLVAFLFSFVTDSIYIQTVIFLITSCLLLLASKPLFKNIMKSTKQVNTNAFSIVNEKGIVISDIDNINGVGQVKINGEIWSAKSKTDEPIFKGTEVTIVSIEGVKAIVSTIN